MANLTQVADRSGHGFLNHAKDDHSTMTSDQPHPVIGEIDLQVGG